MPRQMKIGLSASRGITYGDVPKRPASCSESHSCVHFAGSTFTAMTTDPW